MNKENSNILIGLGALVLLAGFIFIVSSSAINKPIENSPQTQENHNHVHTEDCNH